MSVPSATAEYSLYKTSQHYRSVAGAAPMNNSVQLADSTCVDECIRECTFAGGHTFECEPVCEISCGDGGLPPRPPQFCDAGYKECFRTGLRPHCCPETSECCHFYDPTTLRDRLDCCPPGKECCGNYSGCYNPITQQCHPSGIWDCPANRLLCNGNCCQLGEVCTPQGCSAPERVCQGKRCAPGEQCTPQGCCPPDRVTSEGCCPAGQALCGDKCCGPGWSCTSDGCCEPGRCCETVPCPPGRSCCGGRFCCPENRECRTVHDTESYGCFPRR